MNLVFLLSVQAICQDKVGCENMMPGPSVNNKRLSSESSERRNDKKDSEEFLRLQGYGVLLAQRRQVLSLMVFNIFNSIKQNWKKIT